MEFYRNRILIDYGQQIVYNPLFRTDGAPFVGMGEKYFSLIDDTEMEIIKCFWEEPASYKRFAPPRRIWGLKIPQLGDMVIDPEQNESYFVPKETYTKKFLELADNTYNALKQLDQIKDTGESLVFNRLERGLFFVLAMQIKNWKNIYFYRGYKKSFNILRDYLLRFPEYESYRDRMILLERNDNVVDINPIQETCICIFNEGKKSTTNIISDKHKGSEIVIAYNGRLDYE